jgi:hypothetical protein
MGSRLALLFDPVEHRVCLPRYGLFDEIAADLAIGIRQASGAAYALPFTRRYGHFEFVEQTNTMNSITYTGYAPDLGLKLVARFTSPFYPRDEKLSTAPVILIELRVERLKGWRWRRMGEVGAPAGEIFFEITSDRIRAKAKGPQVRLKFASTANEHRRAPGIADPIAAFDCTDLLFAHTHGVPRKAKTSAQGFTAAFDLEKADQSGPLLITWCAFTTEPVLEIQGRRYPFKYTQFFASENELLDYVILERDELVRRSAFFDALFANTGLGSAHENLLAFAFHSFRLNTWWTLWEEGRDWFSVWEGSCYYHSTIDVEYNNALLYLALWPELLERLLEQWTRFALDGAQALGQERGADTAYLAHDMGSGGRVDGPHYHHSMEVEENCNFLLLVHAHWRWTGRDAIIERHYPLLLRLARFVVMADSTGNGVPDCGVANTIDDATPALQYGRDQVYLGFKTYAALEKAYEIARHKHDAPACELLHRQATRLSETLEGRGWLVDHYAVTLSEKSNGVYDSWKGKALDSEALDGWNAYSIYTSNGLLYPFLVGSPVWVNRRRMRRDVINSLAKTLTEYGCTHTSECTDRLWISQNLWRDYTAAYLDLDLFDHASRYWDYQVLTGRNRPITCFYDTVGNNLCFYPRGVAAIGALFAACQFQLDRVKHRCRVRPMSTRLNLPLLALARWDKQQVPRLACSLGSEKPLFKITHRNCLRGLNLTIGE